MSQKIIVTGATGLVGSHLLIELTQKHEEVTALYRNEESKKLVNQLFSYYKKSEEYKKVVWEKGDIKDLKRLKTLFIGATTIYHTAALVSFEKKVAEKLYETNVNGTKNVLEAIEYNNVSSFVFISSVASIRNKNSAGYFVEEGSLEGDRDWTDYAKSKTKSEKLVLEAKRGGLKTVIVNPGVILGPGEISRSSTAIFNTIKQGLSFYTLGINGFVDVRDVVDAALLLSELDSSEDRYICVGDNITFKHLFETISKAMNIDPPKYKANQFLLAVAWRIEAVIAKVQQRDPKLTKENTSSALEVIRYDSSLLKNELSFKFRPLEKASENTANFFRFLEKH
jgi:nucleoside-diphosphate-sugar epimerase